MTDITYASYQTFPSDAANSLQTITNLKYLVRAGHDIRLVFPNRRLNSSGKLNVLQNHYEFSENFEVEILKHGKLFRDYEKKVHFKKLRFHISHYLWAKKACNYLISSQRESDIFITRSDWLFYFLAMKKKKVLFECHQISKVRKYVINKCIKLENVDIIFTHPLLQKDLNIDEKYFHKCAIIENAYDEDFFNKEEKQKDFNTVIFIGNILRFGESRGLEFVIDAFKDSRLSSFKLLVVGGPTDKSNEYSKLIADQKIKNINFLGQLSRSDTISVMQKSGIGLLINSSESIHSLRHTSPLKYFEYLRAELKILAVDFDSHRKLPFSKFITFFNEKDKEMFINQLISAKTVKNIQSIDYKNFSYDIRVKKIEERIARLEGLEPPTL